MTESQHQINFVNWLRYHYPELIFWHTPNGELRSALVAAKLKHMGVMRGVPDIFIPEYKCFIEMKNQKGILSKDQKALKVKLESYGYTWVTAYGFLDAVEKVTIALSKD